MRRLHGMILKSFLPVFLISMLFFVLIILMVDLFSNLWKYMEHEAEISAILRASFIYLPKAAHLSIPAAMLFSVVFTLGSYQAKHELIAVFASGVSLIRFSMPLILFAFILSVASFLFQETVVIDTYQEKQELSSRLIGRSSAESNSNIVLLSGERHILYRADYYNHRSQTLTRLSVVIQKPAFQRLEAAWAEFVEGRWVLHDVRSFRREGDQVIEVYAEELTRPFLDESPASFKRQIRNIDELKRREAKEWLSSLDRTGNPRYHKELTDYYERYSFSITPLIVSLLSLSISGFFRKNILLMSLLSSLVVSVLYYVSEMIMVLMAKQGIISPMGGAWAGVLFFLILSLFLLRRAKT